nr:RNA-directed DNA polymerase, eukaryota, reverse transcriptase zinc-binding domain protein [Tanacetum cinerariifolium]
MESPHLVKHEFFEHFKNRFEKPNKSRILLERDFIKRIFLEQNDDLERKVSNKEIKKAVWDCGIDKAPGPDGFIFGFYRRQILDGPFILNEIVHWCKNKKKQSMFFKVDFEKAYDSVRWDIIDDILRRFGFGEKWCKWIQSCLYSSRGSVLVNRSPTKEFQFHKGLKQGDPLSPFLFILVMESLHVSFQRVVDAGLFNGIKLDSSLQISHLFYVDDAIFMGQWSQFNIDTIIRVPDVFIVRASKYGIYSCAFFNGADVNSKKPSCVRWKSVLAAKDNSLWVRVVKALHGEDKKIGKKVQPRRNQRGGVEQAQFERLKEMVEDVTLSNSNDRWSWSLVGSGDFSVSSVRKLIDNVILPKGISKARWIKEVPIKINVHA